MVDVRVFIPTLNAGSGFAATLDALSGQTVPHELHVVDSGSTDGTPTLARMHGAIVQEIARHTFNHGSTRNLAVSGFEGTVLVFLTQDAVPEGELWLRNLIRPIVDGEASAAFCRQVPRIGASPIESFARSFNYPASPARRRRADLAADGVRALFFSNVASAVSREAFLAVGGFPDNVIMNEDMALAARLLEACLTIHYASDAVVQHSHDYSLGQQFSRSFDAGVFFGAPPPGFPSVRAGSEGVRFVRALCRHLARQGRWHLIPYALLESAARYVGFQLGRRSRPLPRALNRRLSNNKGFWGA